MKPYIRHDIHADPRPRALERRIDKFLADAVQGPSIDVAAPSRVVSPFPRAPLRDKVESYQPLIQSLRDKKHLSLQQRRVRFDDEPSVDFSDRTGTYEDPYPKQPSHNLLAASSSSSSALSRHSSRSPTNGQQVRSPSPDESLSNEYIGTPLSFLPSPPGPRASATSMYQPPPPPPASAPVSAPSAAYIGANLSPGMPRRPLLEDVRKKAREAGFARPCNKRSRPDLGKHDRRSFYPQQWQTDESLRETYWCLGCQAERPRDRFNRKQIYKSQENGGGAKCVRCATSNQITHHKCSICDVLKPLSQYANNQRAKAGSHICIPCQRVINEKTFKVRRDELDPFIDDDDPEGTDEDSSADEKEERRRHVPRSDERPISQFEIMERERNRGVADEIDYDTWV